MNELLEQQIKATVYNFAFGDAWGYVTEFKKFKDIKKNQYGVPEILKVSDDTQMGLYTIQAIQSMVNDGTVFDNLDFNDAHVQNNIRKVFADEYLKFYWDKDNNRAPGMTCMEALEEYAYSRRKTGLEGSKKNNSLGCGTIMRTPWIGLLPYSRETLANLSVLHSQTTHGDPAGWIVSAVLTLMINDRVHIIIDKSQAKLMDNYIPVVYEAQQSLFEHALMVLEELWQLNLDILSNDEDSFLKIHKELTSFSNHWAEIEHHIREVDGDFVDVNAIFGEGWIATETLYNALGVASLYSGDSPENVFKGMKRLVYTNGDSDSITAVGGALWGAGKAVSVIPEEEMLVKLENRYSNELFNMIEFIIEQY